jgi:hypothetical protein
MSRVISVERMEQTWAKSHYDLAVAAIGYEQRSRYLFETYNPLAAVKVAGAFPDQHVFSFEENVKWFRNQEYEVKSVADEDFGLWIGSLLEGIRLKRKGTPGRAIRVVVDISSLNRLRIANVISALMGSEGTEEIVVDFLYSLAKFTAPIEQIVPNTHVGPVSKNFAGWWREPDRVLSAVVGIGYEQDKALGAVEYLQAQDIWLFQPESEEREYTAELNTANDALLKAARPGHHFVYQVHDPMDCFSRLRSLVLGLAVQNNVILLPFGPKIFVLCCLLVAGGDDRLAVWRVSAQTDAVPVNRIGSGLSYGLRVRFTASDDMRMRLYASPESFPSEPIPHVRD